MNEAVAPPTAADTPDTVGNERPDSLVGLLDAIPPEEPPTPVTDPVGAHDEHPTIVLDPADDPSEAPTTVMDPVRIAEDEPPTTVMDPVGTHEEEPPTTVMDPVTAPGGTHGSPAHDEAGLPFDERPTEVMPGPGEAGNDRPPENEDELARKLQIRVIDTSQGVVDKAHDYADAHLAEQTTQHGVRGFLKRIWHGNVARDYTRVRKSQEGREEIVSTGNLYSLDNGSQAEHNQEMSAVVTRFTEGYLHEGEREDRLADTQAGASLEAELRTLVNFYAQGGIEADALTEEKNRVLERYREQLHGEDRNKGLLLADNVVEVARTARAALAHGVGMERIQAALSAKVGEARTGQRTEARRELTDRIVDKLYSNRVGSLLNESTVALAAGIGMTVAKLTTRKAFTAAAATVSMGVGAGVIAGVREHARIGHERQQHIRERAAGQAAPIDAKRREQLEETRYETVAASDLTDRLAAAREAVADASPTGIQEALQTISETEARIRLSDQESVDLIDFSRTTSIEQERLGLDIALAEAKVAASRALESTDESTLAAQGLDRDLDRTLERRLEGVHEVLRDDMDAKDAVFSKVRRNRTIKMAAAGLVTGLAIGEAVQEAHALFSESLKGVFEGPNSHIDRHSLLAGFFNNPSGDESYRHGVHEAVLGKHAALELPKNYHMEKVGGHWNLISPDGSPAAEGLALDGHGHLTAASMDALQHSGLHMGDEQVQNYTTKSVVHHTIHRGAQEFLNRHPSDFTHAERQFWYDNDTPGVFDQNELKLDWGANGTGIDPNGNYVFNVAQMLPDGSYHDGFSADAQQLFHENKMAIALSMTHGTQDHVVMVPIDAHGNAVIKADSWMAKSLFENNNGQANFTGAYAEAVQLLGKHDGTEAMRPLATVVGSGQAHEITDTVSRVVTHHNERIVTHLIHGHHHVEIPPVFPLYARRGLETPEDAGPEAVPYYTGGYIAEGYRASEGLMPRRGLAPFSPELEANPDAKIDGKGATKRYLRSLRPGYKRIIDSLADDLKKERKADSPKIIIMIPAAAHQEGKNIRNTLEQYANQEDFDRNEFEVVVFANYPRGAKRDDTISEVKKFQKENPNVNVRLVQKRLEKDEANIGWIRKAVTDTVLTDLTGRGVDLEDVILVSNDADCEWINPKYLKTIRDKAEAAPDVDGFFGFIDWGYDAYKAHPEMLAATRFMQMIDIYLRVAKHDIGSSGANFAFRPGIYSAVGGYRAGAPLAEDVALGRMMKSVRAGANTRRPIAFLGRSSEVNTSARRALAKLLKDGGAPIEQWEDGFGTDDELRTRSFDLRDFDLNDEVAVREMVSNTERMLNQTLKPYAGQLQTGAQPSYRQGRLTMYDNETIRQLNRICFFLGLQVHWQPDGALKIDDATKMVEGLKEWQSKH